MSRLPFLVPKRMTNSIAEKKWAKFIRRAKLFNSVPFVDFALAAGSMAMGNPHKHSDFDVIVGVKKGRIFTARFFAVIMFGLRGWRRKKAHDKNVDPKSVADKICLSHWVTGKSYRLSPPHNAYWHKLYQSLVPLTGDEGKIREFFEANDWLKPRRIWPSESANSHELADGKPDKKFRTTRRSSLRVALEIILSGKLGDEVEKSLKKLQVERIKGGLNDKNNFKPRLICSDHELEFHPDTRRIEEMIANQQL